MTDRSMPDPRRTSTRSPVPTLVGSLAAGALLAVALLLGPASGGSEPLVTGSVLFAFGLGWGLMAVLTTRFSAQPQTWMAVPAVFLGSIGLGLIVFQPSPAVMDLLSWVWPPALAILAIWMVVQVRRQLRGRGRWLVVPVIATLLVFAVGGAITTVGAGTVSTASSQTGRMIDVGGHRLYIECTGTGSPVVVLQSGLGESSSYWGRIAPRGRRIDHRLCLRPRRSRTERRGRRAAGRDRPRDRPAHPARARRRARAVCPRRSLLRWAVRPRHSQRAIPTRSPGWCCSTLSRRTHSPRYPTTRRPIRSCGLSIRFRSRWLASVSWGPFSDCRPISRRRRPLAPHATRSSRFPPPWSRRRRSRVWETDHSSSSRPVPGSRPAGSMHRTGCPASPTNSSHRVLAAATHSSIINGVDAGTSSQAILDVVSSVRTGTAVR